MDSSIFSTKVCEKYQCHTLLMSIINEEKSCVLIREFACARAVDARRLIMFVTRHHAKHVLNYEYLTATRILHSVLA